jgi:acyl carrier protein
VARPIASGGGRLDRSNTVARPTASGGGRLDRSNERSSMSEQEILEQVRGALAQIKVPGAEEAGMETTWADLDVDSLDLVEVVRILEDHYGIQIVDEKLEGVASVGDAVRLIQSIAAEQEGVSA